MDHIPQEVSIYYITNLANFIESDSDNDPRLYNALYELRNCGLNNRDFFKTRVNDREYFSYVYDVAKILLKHSHENFNVDFEFDISFERFLNNWLDSPDDDIYGGHNAYNMKHLTLNCLRDIMRNFPHA